MSRKSRPVVLAGLTLALVACEQSITSPVIPEVEFQALQSVATLYGSCVAPGAGLVSWWPGEGNYDDIAAPIDVAVDPNPNPFVQLPRNGDSADPTTTYEAGMVGQAFRFAGVDGQRGHYVEAADAPDLRPASFTIDMWAQRLGDGQRAGDVVGSMLIQKAIADDVLASGISYYISWRGDGRIVADVGFGSQAGAPRLIGAVVPMNTWVHVALTVDDNLNATLYLDGAFQAGFTGTAGVVYGDGSVVVGNNWFVARSVPNNYNRGFDGRIDELDLFDHALSAEEIAAIHGAGDNGKCNGEVEVPEVPDVYPLTIDKARVKLDRHDRHEKDAFDVAGRLPLDLLEHFDPDADDGVTVVFAGVEFWVSAASFVRKDDKWDFEASRPTWGIRKMDLHDDGRFKIKARGEFYPDLHEIDFGEPVDFSLSFGSYVGGAAVQLDWRLRYKSHDKSHDGDDELEDERDDDVDRYVDGDADSDGDGGYDVSDHDSGHYDDDESGDEDDEHKTRGEIKRESRG